MPYLNWRDVPVQSEVMHSEEGRTTLRARFSLELKAALVAALGPTLLEGAGELRQDLPRNCVLFWKTRDEESRLLLAHPQKEEWVATFALEARHAREFLQALETLTPNHSILLSAFGFCGSVSNTDLTLECYG